MTQAPRSAADWEKALTAYYEVTDFVKSPRGQEYLRAWTNRRRMDYGQEHAQPSFVAAAHLNKDLETADTIFITEEMQEVTYRAMGNFRHSEPVGLDDFFIQNGFAYLSSPFYSRDFKGKKTCWRAISWNVEKMWTIDPEYREILSDRLAARGIVQGKVDPFDLTLRISEKDVEGIPTATEEWTVRISLWAHADDVDDYNFRGEWSEGVRLGIDSPWLVTHTTTIPFSTIPEVRQAEDEGGSTDAAWLIFLRVLNRLMSEKLFLKNRREAPRPLRRWMIKKNLPIRDVVVVELRRRMNPQFQEGDGAHRDYSHRFIVSGHWRNQWYPSMQRHRQKYIPDYVKGPDDKPLVLKDRVWNFDR